MNQEQEQAINPRIAEALAELQGVIQTKYPTATFRIARGEDPEGFYLKATVDVEDTDEVVDVFMDRLLEMEIEEGLPVYVIPIRPIGRAVRASRPARTLSSHLFGGVLNPSS